AIDNKAAIADVNILVDNTWVGVAKLGMSRTDVCAAFPNQLNCPNVGWTYQLDTTQLADGPHVITALATSANIAHAIVATPITVANSGAKATNLLRLWIDVPAPQNSTFSGEATFAGWAGDDTAPVNSITALVDHTATFYGTWVPVSMRQSRPDVCAVYPSAQDCPNPGWSAVVDTTQLANGPHILSITATDSNGISNTLTANFTVANTSPLKIYIDQPNSNSGTLTGTSLFSGWALDPNAKITDVELLIDGSFYYFINGEAYYSGTYVGGYRPDVCVVYPASPDCPNVGWSTQFDTSQLANGSHTMAIRADAGNGDRATTPPVSFNVANGLTSKSTKVWIDQPSNSITQTFWGQAQFAGWALDDMAQISTVMISIDGNPNGISSVTYIQRNDVCAVYPSRPGCPNVGWSVDVDTTALTNGTHTVTATAISANGSQATQSTTFQVSNSLGGDGTRLYIDSPNSQTGDVGGHLTVAGWALSSQYSINNVSLAVDGAPFGSATLGVSRPDVCTVFPSGSDCPNVGWSGTIDTTLLSKGPHKLEVTAQAGYPYSSQALPDQSATASVLFNALNANAANPVSVYIDVPSATGASLSGVTSFAGWAIDINDSISSVEITIDGAPYGTATYGANRPDVCAAFPNDNGCPAANVGWNFAIDTTLLPNGSHTLAVTATSSDGLHETVSKSFKVSN
ncbi:MAG: hypothetical protein JO061_03030, partial [Acidobacteriaceae bacterium]|nr:hypothetical protein [Acidobacteriaceae bacterium]